ARTTVAHPQRTCRRRSAGPADPSAIVRDEFAPARPPRRRSWGRHSMMHAAYSEAGLRQLSEQVGDQGGECLEAWGNGAVVLLVLGDRVVIPGELRAWNLGVEQARTVGRCGRHA